MPQKQTVKGTPTPGHRHLVKTSCSCVPFSLAGAHSPRAHNVFCANTRHNRKTPPELFVRCGCLWPCDLWASHCQATSWIILCLLEINFCWSHMEVETTAFEYLHPANKIYVPWKAKKAAISCFLTFIVSFSLVHTSSLVGRNAHAHYGDSFPLCQLCFR